MTGFEKIKVRSFGKNFQLGRKATYHYSNLLMAFSVLLLAGFLVYYVAISFQNEKNRIAKEVGYLFINAVKGVEGNLFNKLLFNTSGPMITDQREVKIKLIKEGPLEGPSTTELNLSPKDSVKKMIHITSSSFEKDNLKDVSGVISVIVNMESDSISGPSGHLKRLHQPVDYFPLIEERFKSNLDQAGIRASYSIGKDTTSSAINESFTASYSDIGTKDKFYVQLAPNTGLILWNILPEIILSLLLLATIFLAFRSILRYAKKQQALLHMKNDFIQNMTHELKTPVATVSIALEAIQNFKASENETMRSEYLDIARNEVSKLEQVVERVLSVSKMAEQAATTATENIDVAAVIHEVVHSLNFKAKQHTVALHAYFPAQDFDFHNQKQSLSIILFNLIDNGINYVKNEHPKVTISGVRRGKTLEISIADNGRPIATELQAKIFEKFYRTPEGLVHDVKGHGLGLHIVQQLVKAMKGKIGLTSTAAGNCFTLQFQLQ